MRTQLIGRWPLIALGLWQIAAQPQLLDRVAAVIEDDIVTVRELEGLAAAQLAQPEPAGQDLPTRQRRRHKILLAVLDQEIGERMLKREMALNKDRLAVSDKDVEHAIDEVARLNHVDRVQLQQALLDQGMSLSAYREKMRSQLERTRLIQFKVQGRVQVKDLDVVRRCRERQRYEAQEPRVCAVQAFVALAPEAGAAALRNAQLQLQTQQQQAAEKGAGLDDLGCFRRGEMLEAIDAVAFALPEGAWSAPVRSPLGLHRVRVSSRRAKPTVDCDDRAAHERFRGELYEEEMQRQMRTWTEELRKKAFVEVRLDGSE